MQSAHCTTRPTSHCRLILIYLFGAVQQRQPSFRFSQSLHQFSTAKLLVSSLSSCLRTFCCHFRFETISFLSVVLPKNLRENYKRDKECYNFAKNESKFANNNNFWYIISKPIKHMKTQRAMQNIRILGICACLAAADGNIIESSSFFTFFL